VQGWRAPAPRPRDGSQAAVLAVPAEQAQGVDLQREPFVVAEAGDEGQRPREVSVEDEGSVQEIRAAFGDQGSTRHPVAQHRGGSGLQMAGKAPDSGLPKGPPWSKVLCLAVGMLGRGLLQIPFGHSQLGALYIQHNVRAAWALQGSVTAREGHPLGWVLPRVHCALGLLQVPAELHVSLVVLAGGGAEAELPSAGLPGLCGAGVPAAGGARRAGAGAPQAHATVVASGQLPLVALGLGA